MRRNCNVEPRASYTVILTWPLKQSIVAVLLLLCIPRVMSQDSSLSSPPVRHDHFDAHVRAEQNGRMHKPKPGSMKGHMELKKPAKIGSPFCYLNIDAQPHPGGGKPVKRGTEGSGSNTGYGEPLLLPARCVCMPRVSIFRAMLWHLLTYSSMSMLRPLAVPRAFIPWCRSRGSASAATHGSGFSCRSGCAIRNRDPSGSISWLVVWRNVPIM